MSTSARVYPVASRASRPGLARALSSRPRGERRVPEETGKIVPSFLPRSQPGQAQETQPRNRNSFGRHAQWRRGLSSWLERRELASLGMPTMQAKVRQQHHMAAAR